MYTISLKLVKMLGGDQIKVVVLPCSYSRA